LKSVRLISGYEIGTDLFGYAFATHCCAISRGVVVT
jgi:hypothetical protein